MPIAWPSSCVVVMRKQPAMAAESLPAIGAMYDRTGPVRVRVESKTPSVRPVQAPTESAPRLTAPAGCGGSVATGRTMMSAWVESATGRNDASWQWKPSAQVCSPVATSATVAPVGSAYVRTGMRLAGQWKTRVESPARAKRYTVALDSKQVLGLPSLQAAAANASDASRAAAPRLTRRVPRPTAPARVPSARPRRRGAG